MKSRMLFREHGRVIYTRQPWRDRVHNTLLALLVAAVIVLLPGLLGAPDEITADPGDAHAQHLADIEAAYAAGMRAGLEAHQCRREKLL